MSVQQQPSQRFIRNTDADFGFKFSFDAGRIVNGENTSCLVNEVETLHQAELLAKDIGFIARSINSYIDGDAHTIICDDEPKVLEVETEAIQSFVNDNPRPGDALIVVGMNYLFSDLNPQKHRAGQSLAMLMKHSRSVIYGITVGPKYPLLFKDENNTTRNFLDYVEREHVFKGYVQCEDAVSQLSAALDGDVNKATRLAKKLYNSEAGLTYTSLEQEIERVNARSEATASLI